MISIFGLKGSVRYRTESRTGIKIANKSQNMYLRILIKHINNISLLHLISKEGLFSDSSVHVGNAHTNTQELGEN